MNTAHLVMTTVADTLPTNTAVDSAANTSKSETVTVTATNEERNTSIATLLSLASDCLHLKMMTMRMHLWYLWYHLYQLSHPHGHCPIWLTHIQFW